MNLTKKDSKIELWNFQTWFNQSSIKIFTKFWKLKFDFISFMLERVYNLYYITGLWIFDTFYKRHFSHNSTSRIYYLDVENFAKCFWLFGNYIYMDICLKENKKSVKVWNFLSRSLIFISWKFILSFLRFPSLFN